MYEVTINHKTGSKKYKVYTKEEADTNNIEYKPWNEAREGEWGITDDNYVSECYSSKQLKKAMKSLLPLPVINQFILIGFFILANPLYMVAEIPFCPSASVT